LKSCPGFRLVDESCWRITMSRLVAIVLVVTTLVIVGPALVMADTAHSNLFTIDLQDVGQPPELYLLDVAELTVVPAAAHADGVGGTRWLTDLVIHNPGPAEQRCSVYFLPSNSDNSHAPGNWVDVLPGRSVAVADVVESLFSQSSAAGALLIGANAPLLVTSRTYNDSASGTYGQFVPGFSDGKALGKGDRARLIQLTRNADFRTNIGFANATGQALQVSVDLYRADGSRLRQTAYTVPPFGYLQKTDIIGIDVTDAFAIVSSDTTGASYFTYASVVDNNSGDPVLVSPPQQAVPAGTEVFIPGAAHVGGAAGTNWRTDCEVHNPGGIQTQFKVELLKKSQANTSPLTQIFTLGPGRSMRYGDILASLFGFSGSGALRVTPITGSIMVSSRTYNNLSSGTFGQFIAGTTIEDSAIDYGEEGRLIQLAQSTTVSAGFRTNIGFVNATSSSITVKVEMFSGNGARLGIKTFDLAPYEFDQVDRILLQVTGDSINNGCAVVTTTTPGGRFFTYASVVDNRSGDPIFIPAAIHGEQNPTPPSTAPELEITDITATSISMSWGSVPDASNYKLYRGSTLIYNGPAQQKTDSELNANTEFCYRAQASNDAGGGPFSSQVCATTLGELSEIIEITLPGGRTMDLVHIPSGTFLMGSPEDERGRFPDEDLHQVTLTRGYFLGKTEVTQSQWEAVMGSPMSTSCGTTTFGSIYPVHCVSWDEVCGGITGSDCAPGSFIGRINGFLGTGKFRLPTEAEWERAARGGTQTEFSFPVPSDWDTDCGPFPEAEPYMWWCGNHNEMLEAVAQKLANPFGLHDMHGNLEEWVADWYQMHLGTGAVQDPFVPPTGSGGFRVIRGGSWDDTPRGTRSAYRTMNVSSVRSIRRGFRLARSEFEHPSPPTAAPDLTAEEDGSDRVRLVWTAVTGATGYRLKRGGSLIYVGPNWFFDHATLAANTEYCYTVEAFNDRGTGPASDQTCATTQGGGTGGGGGEIITFTLPGGVTIDLTHIPALFFMMGSPDDERGRNTNEDMHLVHLTRGYYLGRFEVTQGQWEAVMGAPMSSECGSPGVGNNHPVYCVSWNDICGGSTGADCRAESFIGRLNALIGSTKFRLPTEAEWERAARGGTQTEFSFPVPSDWDTNCGPFFEAENFMWWCGNDNEKAEPVGLKLPNPYGLYDMHGNVKELVADWYEEHLTWQTAWDPTGPATGFNRVIRGGNWVGSSERCRSASRAHYPPSSGQFSLGFRLAMSGFEDPTPPVTSPSLTATAASSNRVELTWTVVNGATGYSLRSGGNEIYKGPNLAFDHTSLSGSTEYCYTVEAFNDHGAGPPSGQICATTHNGGGVGEVITITLPGSVTMDLVRIPAGILMMGSPGDERGRESNEDLHQVRLTSGYYLGRTEVTQAQWEAVMGSPMSTSCGSSQVIGPTYPVGCVSWDEVCGGATGSNCSESSFIGRLNSILGTSAFRLPTEAEWEYAARGGSLSEFSFSVPSDWDKYCGAFPEAEPHMWWCGNNDPYGSKPVGTKLPNPYGLYDMHGNFYEWVADWYQEHLGNEMVTDPTGPISGSLRANRNCSWNSSSAGCRSAVRGSFPSSFRTPSLGFRLARTE
jgi:formylglycine-generating enzyme required for sulfatase activity